MKAIIVLDEMPTVCFDCPLGHVIKYKEDDDIDMVCEAQTYNPTKARTVIKGDIFNINKKPSWCPLKEMPQKKDTSPNGSTSYRQTVELARRVGWNECLEEITNDR